MSDNRVSVPVSYTITQAPGLSDSHKFAIWRDMSGGLFWDRFRRAMAHAFATGQAATLLSPQDLQLLQKVADAIVSRRLETPAVLLLESSEPLNFLSSQIVQGLRPFLDLVCAPAETERLAGILERRDAVSRLVEMIHAQADKRPPPRATEKSVSLKTGVSS